MKLPENIEKNYRTDALEEPLKEGFQYVIFANLLFGGGTSVMSQCHDWEDDNYQRLKTEMKSVSINSRSAGFDGGTTAYMFKSRETAQELLSILEKGRLYSPPQINDIADEKPATAPTPTPRSKVRKFSF